MASPALAWFGFEPGPDNAPGAIMALAVIYAAVPTVLKISAVMVVWNHPITAQRQSVIRRRLDSLAGRASKGPSS